MRYSQALELSLCILAGSMTVLADQAPLDCAQQSLADAVASAVQGASIRFTGGCAGPVVVRTGGLSLTGVGTAVIDGGKSDAVTIGRDFRTCGVAEAIRGRRLPILGKALPSADGPRGAVAPRPVSASAR